MGRTGATIHGHRGLQSRLENLIWRSGHRNQLPVLDKFMDQAMDRLMQLESRMEILMGRILSQEMSNSPESVQAAAVFKPKLAAKQVYTLPVHEARASGAQ